MRLRLPAQQQLRARRRLLRPLPVRQRMIPKPGGSGELDAWLVAPSINLAQGVTELHAFEAGRVSDGPVVSWRADVALPAGFHGAWAR